MADITYIIKQDLPENITGVEQISQLDSQLINEFEINNLFNRDKHYVELHVFDLVDNLLESDYNYTNYKQLGNAQSAGKEGASILTIDPIEDIKKYSYSTGDVKLFYNFLNDLFTGDKSKAEFYIQEISSDRTELKLQTLKLFNEEVSNYVTKIKEDLLSQSYFTEFRLNFQNNNLLIGVNIDILIESGNNVVAVKLYEPLPEEYTIKSTLNIVEIISDSAVFQVESSVDIDIERPTYLRPANFNIETLDNEVVPTEYLNYQELFSFPINNSNNELYSLINEKGAELSINHSEYSNFVHFSSAYERLLNFKYKLSLLENYSENIAQVENSTSQSVGTVGSIQYFTHLTEGILNNFDHYERFLYYESSSYSWPKSNSTKPYENLPTTSSIAINWYSTQLSIANRYDATNLNALVNTIPSFLRDDTNNENYLTFIHMIGQHFDNLWIYTKGVSDKYDADNRLNFGISKDLIGEVLKNFGVKLYTSNKSTEDLFSSFIGQSYQSGSEQINFYITGSLTGSNTPIEPSSLDNYQKEIHKRFYHNLPLLLKSKGTERGLRALINCFGIPSDILKIKYYGGRNIEERPFLGEYQYYTSSLDKVRLDNTGSITSGSTLSGYTSIIKRDGKYTDDLHTIEVGFSPTDNVDNYIISQLANDFNINDYLGDPRNLTSNTYQGLNEVVESIISTMDTYDVKDYVRLIKFFDNTVFRMIKDFIPARTVPNTGIIIKPHILDRSKAKSVEVTYSQPEYSGSIDTAFISGSNGGSFKKEQGENTTVYEEIVQTPTGLRSVLRHLHEEAKFDGEFSNSELIVTNGELNNDNTVKYPTFNPYLYNISFWGNADNLCILANTPPNGNDGKYYITPGTYPITSFFSGLPTNGEILLDNINVSFPYTFTTSSYTQYQEIDLQVSNTNIQTCTSSADIVFGVCELGITDQFPSAILPETSYNITTWFTTGSNPPGSIQYSITPGTVVNPSAHIFGSTPGISYTVKIEDIYLGGTCSIQGITTTSLCSISAKTVASVPQPKEKKMVDSFPPPSPLPLVYEFQYTPIETGINDLYFPNEIQEGVFNELGLASFFLGIQEGVKYNIGIQSSTGDFTEIFSEITPGTTGTYSDPFNTFNYNYQLTDEEGRRVCRLFLGDSTLVGRGVLQITAFTSQQCFQTYNIPFGPGAFVIPINLCTTLPPGERPIYCAPSEPLP